MIVYAEKGNRVRRIDEADIQKYLDMGYNITDPEGKVLQETVPLDPVVLKSSYIEHIAKIKELEAEITKLKAELSKAKSAAKTTSKVNKPEKEVVEKTEAE